MKKSILFLLLVSVFFVTACGSSDSKSNLNNKKTRTIEDLMDGYVRTFVELDYESGNLLYPQFYYDRVGKFTKEKLEEMMENTKESYGDNFNIKYNITKTIKMTEEELKKQNEVIQSRFETEMEASECYKYEGTITFKGSEFEDTDPIDSLVYCKYDGEWYLSSNVSE